MAKRTYDEILARIYWDPSLDPQEYLIVYEDRSDKRGFRPVRASDIAEIVRTAFILHNSNIIPMHLIREIRDLKTGQTLAGRRVPLAAAAIRPVADGAVSQERPSLPGHCQRAGSGNVPRFSGVDVAVRAGFPEEAEHRPWPQRIAEYSPVGAVEVAFHRVNHFLDKVNLRDVIEPLERNGVRASSVHMAHARVAERESFVAVLRKTLRIAQALDCRIIVAHPSHGRLQQLHGFIEDMVTPMLEEAGVVLCWETFSGSRRFVSGIEGIAELCQRNPYHRACYDTSHLHKPQQEVLDDIRKYATLIRCFHLSNRRAGHGEASQHLPLRDPEGELDFSSLLSAIAASGFTGSVTLEYLPQHHGQLVDDARWVKHQLAQVPP